MSFPLLSDVILSYSKIIAHPTISYISSNTKNYVLSKFLEFKNLFEVKVLRTDHGTDFTNYQFKKTGRIFMHSRKQLWKLK